MILFSWDDIINNKDPNSKSFDYFSKNNCPNGTAITIGGFDGMHRGHQSLFNTVLSQRTGLLSTNKMHNMKENKKGVSKVGIVTFLRSPRVKKQKDNFPGDLSTNKLRKEYFKKQGFDFCVLIDFSQDFSKIKGLDFLTVLRNSCSMQFLSVGTDFRCGRGLDTGVFEIKQFCSQYGLQFVVCAEVLYNGMRISSSAVRSAVQQGKMLLASDLLGYNYTLDGEAFKWRIDYTAKKKFESVTKTISAHKSDSLQVLPPAGTYPVDIAGFNTLLYVDTKYLHLEIPLEQARPATVKKIEFIKYLKE